MRHEAKIVTCHGTMDVVPDGESVAHISVAGIGPVGTGHITLTGSVNGVSLSPFKNGCRDPPGQADPVGNQG